MNRAEALVRLATGMQTDHAAFRSMRELLEAQFQAALRHQSSTLAGLADEIVALCGEIETRRKERVALVDALAPQTEEPIAARIGRILSQLPEPHDKTAESLWRALEREVGECRTLNARNCALMMNQYDIMQRVLSDGSETYAPA